MPKGGKAGGGKGGGGKASGGGKSGGGGKSKGKGGRSSTTNKKPVLGYIAKYIIFTSGV